MKLKDAKSHIASRGFTLGSARHKLGLLVESAHLLRIFEQMFPAEFNAPVENALEPTGSLGVVPVWLEKFFDLVRERLFPLPDFYLDEEELECWVRAVPFWPMLPDPYEIEVDELPTYYKLALALMGDVDRKVILGEQLAPERAEIFLDAGTRIDSARLRRMCERAGGPIEHFVLALDVVTRSAGNDWIDISPEECGAYDFEWSVETLNALAEEYKKADAIMRKVNAFDDWLDLDPSNIEIACAFWMKAADDAPEDDAAQMVFTVDGAPLVPERPAFELATAAAIG